MTYRAELTSPALADLEKLSSTIQNRILRKVQWLADNFEAVTPIALSSNLSGLFKLRVGDYRVIYLIDTGNKQIIVQQVGHRRDVYR